MENSTLSIVILALVVYRWFPVTENNLLILVDSRTDDVTKLRSINSLISAFKIETSINTYWKEHPRENDKKVSCFYNNTNSNSLTIKGFSSICLNAYPYLFSFSGTLYQQSETYLQMITESFYATQTTSEAFNLSTISPFSHIHLKRR